MPDYYGTHLDLLEYSLMNDIKEHWKSIIIVVLMIGLLLFVMFNFLAEDALARKECWNYGYDHGYYEEDDGGIICRDYVDTPIGDLVDHEK